MAIAAQRFKFLDKETSVPTKDLLTVTDNQVYNNATKSLDSAIAGIKDSNGMLSKMNKSIDELHASLLSEAGSIGDDLKSALNDAIDNLSGLEMPDIVKDIFASLKEMDLDGVKDFFKDMLHVGSTFLCNNLDFLKMFMLGYALSKNVLAGLVTALLLSWLDRYCKGFSAQEMAKTSGLGKLEKMFPPKGSTITPISAFQSFTNTYSDYLKASEAIQTPAAPTSAQFLADASAGNAKALVASLRQSEVSSDYKKGLQADLDAALLATPVSDPAYNNLLQARGELANMPLISAERRDQAITYARLSDQLGSLSKNLTSVDLSEVNRYDYDALQNGLHDKIVSYQTSVKNNPDLMSRNLRSGSFSDVDFSTVLPTLTPEETSYIAGLNHVSTAHRVHDIHPTTEVFFTDDYRHVTA